MRRKNLKLMIIFNENDILQLPVIKRFIDAIYIGQRGRQIEIRLKEHKESIKDKRQCRVAYSIQNKHSFNINIVLNVHHSCGKEKIEFI